MSWGGVTATPVESSSAVSFGVSRLRFLTTIGLSGAMIGALTFDFLW
jgi:hypothetical protein